MRAMTVELAWDDDGPHGAPVLVLLNSVGCSNAMWDPHIGALAEQFRVLRIDARGHGRSPAAPSGQPCTIADLGGDVLAVFDRLDLSRVNIAGVSLGGMTAMWLAIHHPRRVARLTLVCTSAFPDGQEVWHERAATVRADGMGVIADAVVARWITPAFSQRDPQLVDELRAVFRSTDAESYAQCCEALGALDLRAELPRIAAPTLVIAGAEDPALPPQHSREVAAGIPGARLEEVGPAAHLAPIEQAGAVTRLLLEHCVAGATLVAGYRTRRAVLGDAHVDTAVANTTALTAPFQEFITRYAWGDVWSRPGLARRERSIATLAALVALGAENEIAIHVRAALRNGLSPAELGEVLLHTALYSGLPRANRGFAIARQVLAELDLSEES
jgi:3-oxoadipate enol-lactonase/4-carboxymuconolactone decarboxylase